MGIVIVIVVVLGFAGIITFAIITKRKREQAMAALATKNGWTGLPNNAALNQYLPSYVQMLGQQNYGFSNYNRVKTNYDMAYQAKIGNHTATLFQYEYTEYRQNPDPQQPPLSENYYFTILNVAMPVNEPSILLLHHGFMSKLTNFGLHSGMEKINLEGNFNDYYDTYITPNGQVEALSLLTPDVMEQVTALAGKKAYASMQFAGPTLAISFENQVLTPEFIEPLLTEVTALLAKLDVKPQNQLSA